MQKLELVKLVRHHAPHAITLSIGDGANDVPMIYGAHVGVAVRGKEGTQAVQASDVAISQFRFLATLLQCHGRRAYRRVALFLIWYIYKNIAEIMCDVIWMHQDKFRARIAIPEFLSIQYNVTLTSWHILFVLGYDHDIPDEVALSNPDLYKVGPRRDLFKPHLFAKWLIFALIHGTVTWILPQIMINGELLNGDDYGDGKTANMFWVCSVASFGVIVFIVCLKLILVAQNWCGRTTLIPTAITLLFYFVAVFGLAYVPPGPALQPCMDGLPLMMFGRSTTILAFVVTIAVALTPDVMEQGMSWVLCPSPLQKVQKNLPGQRTENKTEI
jgi:phospholipid-transporting ATPase